MQTEPLSWPLAGIPIADKSGDAIIFQLLCEFFDHGFR